MILNYSNRKILLEIFQFFFILTYRYPHNFFDLFSQFFFLKLLKKEILVRGKLEFY